MIGATPRDDVRRAMVVCAHPDDVDFGAAGTVASWTSAGVEVTYCVATRGEASGDGSRPRAEVGATRQAEQLHAADLLGVAEVVFLDHPDGAVEPTTALRRDLTRVIRRVRPQRVLGWSPEINWDHVPTAHPDHRAVGAATFAAIYPDARNPNAYPDLLAEEGLEPWAVSELWIADAPKHLRNHCVDTTEFFERRMAALRCHVSQVGANTELESRMHAHFTDTAARYGLPRGRLAEEFQVVNTG
ncbi:PIG-L deacetylase family protein [Actinokineospora cianjurensis]|uniref:LmbE family N-acetylglucosaminyl deacetylase n=1 Tax=Actinokineospora cianjurensis TaxID=585224 RepID=A0A421B8R8_9PSEU|nr:PIG-L deacetylase family protein [Actinokineospora cianjurensis]RLK60922.1 LmbE family N-acetylglucosaminyl deacetylase [Actinokineospora cianjurensis]